MLQTLTLQTTDLLDRAIDINVRGRIDYMAGDDSYTHHPVKYLTGSLDSFTSRNFHPGLTPDSFSIANL